MVIWPNTPAHSGSPFRVTSQGHIQDHVQKILNIYKNGDSTTCQSVPTLSHHHSEKCFLIFRVNLLCFMLCPLSLSLSLGTYDKQPISIFFTTSPQICILMNKSPQSANSTSCITKFCSNLFHLLIEV